MPRNSRGLHRMGGPLRLARACAGSGAERWDGPVRPTGARRRSRHAYGVRFGGKPSTPRGSTSSPAAPTGRSGSGRSRTASSCGRSGSRWGPKRSASFTPWRSARTGRRSRPGALLSTSTANTPIYLFDRESGALVRRIHGDLPDVVHFLTFSPDGRYLAATLGENNGIRVFDRNNDWHEAFRDEAYGDESYGASFASRRPCRDGVIRRQDPPLPLRAGCAPIRTSALPAGPSRRRAERKPYRIAFSPDGKRLAVGYNGRRRRRCPRRRKARARRRA